nr:hypothetical protein [Geomesophilobacter sediminis]
MSRYVVLNPVRAGMVATPEQWPWSSYLPLLEGPGASKVLTSQWMLSQFGGTTSEALKKYRDFVLKEDPQDRSPWWRVNGEVVFGTEEFATKIHALVGAKEETPEIPSLQRHVGRPALEVLFPKGRTAPRGERNCAIGDAHLKYGYGLKQIADHIGMHYTSISKVIKTLLVKK